jgi:hypothetical protein
MPLATSEQLQFYTVAILGVSMLLSNFLDLISCSAGHLANDFFNKIKLFPYNESS